MKHYLTLDIGGTDIKYGVITEDMNLVFKSLTPTNSHLGGQNIINEIKRLFNELSNDYKLEGIAISSTGAINNETQVLTPSFTIVDFEKVNFKNDLAELNVPVTAENDVNSMGLCEFNLVPNFDKMTSVLAIAVGTGIGSAISINGQLLKGSAFTGGEVGKMIIDRGLTFEEIASSSALVKFAKEVNPSIENGLQVFELYDAKDEAITKVVNQFYSDLALGLANLIYILNPEHIILGGGVSARGDRFLNELSAALKDKLWGYLYDRVTLSIAKHKNDAGMIGAFINFKNTYL